MAWRRAAVRMNFGMIANSPLLPTPQRTRIGPVLQFHGAGAARSQWRQPGTGVSMNSPLTIILVHYYRYRLAHSSCTCLPGIPTSSDSNLSMVTYYYKDLYLFGTVFFSLSSSSVNHPQLSRLLLRHLVSDPSPSQPLETLPSHNLNIVIRLIPTLKHGAPVSMNCLCYTAEGSRLWILLPTANTVETTAKFPSSTPHQPGTRYHQQGQDRGAEIVPGVNDPELSTILSFYGVG
ncbi:uncharacterized protein BJ212DRAFT_1302095 [Suillus subaureus]|uniref:Uncharacterized protein n=1 Tax=Suillus subaureus TaxID=48587 RepID=A0A9P7E544_9AGAM|nr:uncharacterized protein BJ212DRAFT_1302095 [Suillus subaureus]KAG1811209.1 hypothetical protein BJ212DRAFT_1302095 [Suillus subaureus]